MKVLVAGLGNMGKSHALAWLKIPGAEIVGLVNRSEVDLPAELRGIPLFADFHEALEVTAPDVAVIATYSDSHAEYAIAALQSGADVFVEKPLATTVADAERVVRVAEETGRKLVVGYILRHHPSWQRLIAESRALGGPYVFRLNLNQQSKGPTWEVHKQLMKTTPPIVDCGVHYVDVMCQITDAAPVEVRGMGVRLSDEIAPEMYNYGHFQVLFEDGSVGWYEAGWGPMMSDTAFFVKDVVSPKGAVSIRMSEEARSDDIDTHTQTSKIRLHRVGEADQDLSMQGEPGHQELCDAEAAFMAEAIATDRDLSRHAADAVASLAVCLAADHSIRTGQPVRLKGQDAHA
ncbi:Gfo/Idh/MocA family protein [Paracoccus aminophilus]|uniref:Oxidoreductase domain-containing protein n=1 Tax=Paracoccus aminophilus JCM 7686 TaxID=1367847 RepID=S5YXE1_PARAH|nr:Gfo/Idh/MocA family oxidoreductase [Paracoccus aminophilus]AGT09891.1 oxidoreductase domain-containing protein [Paracoccus aminophilus JCM 7686]